MTDWDTFCVGVLTHPELAAPITDANVDTMWAWSNAETAPFALMRWWNPMNSTEPWPGAVDSGAQPGPHDVKIYASLQDGINATAFTLTQEPFYPAICDNLRASLPRQQWGATSAAGAELHAWGTGTAWLTTAPYFGPAPLGDFMLTPDEHNWVQEAAIRSQMIIAALGISYVPDHPELSVSQKIADIEAAIAKLVPPAPQDLTALIAAIQANTAQLAAQTTELNAISTKLDNLTLKAQP